MKDTKKIEAVAERLYRYGTLSNIPGSGRTLQEYRHKAFIEGALSKESEEYHQKGMYNEREVLSIISDHSEHCRAISEGLEDFTDWFESIKKK